VILVRIETLLLSE